MHIKLAESSLGPICYEPIDLGFFVMKKSTKEKRMLVECAETGFGILNEYVIPSEAERFYSSLLIPQSFKKFQQIENYLYSNNVDVFYATLSVINSAAEKSDVDKVISCTNANADLMRSLDFIEHSLYKESEFERNLTVSIKRRVALTDDEIRADFTSKFDIIPTDILSLPTDRSLFFAKVNHGLWEFVRGAYDDARQEHGERFRDIDVGYLMRAGRTSGLSQHWGRQIYRYLSPKTPSPSIGVTSFCVSLTAGTEAPINSIRKNLNPITRGAAIGLLSMFETARPDVSRYTVGDGGAPRALISEKQLEEFFFKYVADSEACLFITPPHLRMIDFVNYKGDIYKFLVPPSKINDTLKVVVATALGYLQRLSGKYQSITILAQGASIIPSLVMLISEVEASFPNTRLRVFDLGRVLDVAMPEILQKQNWAVLSQDEFIQEGKKIFRNTSEADFTLATLI